MNPPTLVDSGLSGGVAIVTGGSRGIGRAIVETLAGAGMEVAFTYQTNAAAAEEVVAAVNGTAVQSGISTVRGRATAQALDIRDAEACAKFAEQLYDRTGRIDLLVNNAGVVRDNPLTGLDDKDIDLVIQTNVIGTFNMSRAVTPYMVSQRRGKIINLSSVAGEKGGRGQTNYAASKGAINAFTRALAVELAPRGICVNAVAPGVIDTEMSRVVRERAADAVQSRILLRRVGRPEEIAYAVWFLSSKYADYITGEILRVDGGFKME